MISRLIVKATLVGVAASLAVAAPALAATKPVLDTPPVTIGFNPVTLTGTAAPNAKVQLYETAYVWPNAMAPAKDYSNNDGPVIVTANAQGKFSFQRDMDSGHYFMAVDADDANNKSEPVAAAVRQLPYFENLTATGNNTVSVKIYASPAQPNLKAQLQKQISGKWVTVGEANTAEPVNGVGGGDAQITATGVSGGAGIFRAFVGGDPTNNVLEGPSAATASLTVPGPVTDPSTPPSTPPTTPTPTPPKPTVPAVGAIQFTRIQYDSPGTDSGSNGSLNTEWVKLTNKTKATINLNGWTVRDAANHVYRFNGTYNLGAGQSVFVITGKGKNIVGKRYWNRVGKAGYIWNNTGDTAIVRHASGKTIDSCKWTKVGAGYTNC